MQRLLDLKKRVMAVSDDIYQNIKKEHEDAKNPTPIYDSIVEANNEKAVDENVFNAVPWYKKLLNPKFRIWAYGVASTATIAGAIWAGKPEFAATAAPLIMAIFFVDLKGNAK